jgi:glutamyl-tRNA reductase
MTTQMNLHCKALSISYKTAPVDIREKIALDEQGSRRLLVRLKEVLGIAEGLIISTCNRTEIYYLADEDLSSQLISLLAVEKCLTDNKQLASYFLTITNHEEAVLRLFRVCIGLESQVVGDIQIINQAKQAYQWAADEGLAGAFLHRLMHAIFFTNKKVVQETTFKDGAASVSYATVELMEELAAQLSCPKILLVGIGEIGRDVARNLKNSPHKANITLINRTQSKALDLGNECGFEVAAYENLWQNIATADIIISTVQHPTPLITSTALQKIDHHSTFKYFIDLAVPRSISPDVEDLTGIILYNIDTINNRANEALQNRLAAIPAVESIILQATEDFYDWSREMIVSPVIHKLKNTLEQIRQEEFARFAKQLTAEETEKLDKMTKSMMQKIIKLPVLQLKAACKRGEAETLVDILNDLFDLEKNKEESKSL